jgi:hypothetical protein
MKRLFGSLALTVAVVVTGTADAQESSSPTTPPAAATTATPPDGNAHELAKKLSNPIADLISVPFQANYDDDIGLFDDGDRWEVKVQPVVPISIGSDWNVISRTIIPIIVQDDVVPPLLDNEHQAGLGDTLQSLFFSPKARGPGGLIWGFGPVALLPTATEKYLGQGKWAVGPTGVALVQKDGWTIGILANQLWSVGGDDTLDGFPRPDVNATFLQPFVSYTTEDAWTFSLNTESTYNWEEHEWSVPVNAMVSKLVKLGRLPVQIGGGIRYWAESPETGPEDFGARMQVTFLFPK